MIARESWPAKRRFEGASRIRQTSSASAEVTQFSNIKKRATGSGGDDFSQVIGIRKFMRMKKPAGPPRQCRKLCQVASGWVIFHLRWHKSCPTVGIPPCQQKNGCALTALDGNGGGKPRALPWAVMWRPFRPCIRTAILEKGGHGFTIDGTAQVLRYSRLGSLRYDVGLPPCQQKNCYALTALDGNYGIKTQGVALGGPVAAFQALYSHRHSGKRRPWIYH